MGYRRALVLMLVTVVLLLSCIGALIVVTAVESDNSYNDEAPIHKSTTKKIETVEQTNELYYNITKEERELLARLVHCEASICNNDCKYAVISVVFNRLECGKWGDTIEEVVYYKNAFTPATSGLLDDTQPTKADYAAVDYVVKNGPSVPTYVRYFRAGHDFSWDRYKNYITLDNVYFGYLEDWQKGAW